METKLIANNRRARHFYHIEKTYEAGLALAGPEVKSLRLGRANINEAYARVQGEEIFIHNMHISPYTEAGRWNPDPRRPRKLLLHKQELKRLIGAVTQKGYTIVPLKLYFSERGYAKLEIALARGKKAFDKKEDLKRRDQEREMEREIRKR
jgi:SsrA-binding protein